MTGRWLGGGLVLFAVLFGAALYYFQVYAYYERVSGLSAITVAGQEVAVSEYDGIDADTSGLKLRGCFRTDPQAFDGLPVAAAPTPLTPPRWFDCFDAAALQDDLDAGRATAYMAAENDKDGIDRLVAVYPDGRGFQWRQLNEKYTD
ncbi:DUF6446 family protein [Oceanomicrobium pacificus]|uniref:Histidine kinase n=1 Tax=Oceanomicrobium pacificus TaxID=2692916 RepID=A0A6B0TUR2_9RHOB|nr:DUF6446 family protein [Oceanomicrobium pacificus]MXU65515.1 histidine kinase [Oceanomicrobium pacificus]